MPLMNKFLFLISISLLFSVGIWKYYGALDAVNYLITYFIEMSLSFDNLIMFYAVFKYYKLDEKQQEKCLKIGFFSAIVLRFIIIFLGSYFINKAHWIIYIFSLFLLFCGYKLFFETEDSNENDISNNKAISLLKKYSSLGHFSLAIASIEIIDIIFAVDSIPASFGVTLNPIIIYSANIFAILSLRVMYFMFLKIINKISWIDKIIGVVLIFLSLKIIIRG